MSRQVRSAFLADPEGFRSRMRRCADRMPSDGYKVLESSKIGVFFVVTPKAGSGYVVDIFNRTCNCAYQEDSSVPEVECKHLQGIEGLIDYRIANLKANAEKRAAQGQTVLAEVYADMCVRLQTARDEAMLARMYDREADYEGAEGSNDGGIRW